MNKFKRIIPSLLLVCFLLGSCLAQKRTIDEDPSVRLFRIVVPSAGYYSIPIKNLSKTINSSFTVDEINLYYLGDPYPFWVVEGNNLLESKILFYAQQSEKSSNIKETIFVLAIDGEDQISRLFPKTLFATNKKDISLSKGTIFQHFEMQNIYLPNTEGDDHWYWSKIPFEYSFENTFSPITNQNYKLNLHLWSPSSAAVNPDHGVQIGVNNEIIEKVNWDGKGKYTIETVLRFPSGTDEIRFQIIPNLRDIQYPQKIYLDAVEIEFQHELLFSNNPFEFSGNNGLVLKRDKTKGFLIFFDEKIPTDLFVLPENEFTSLTNLNNGTFSWVPEISFSNSIVVEPINIPIFEYSPVDYVVVSPPEFHSALAPLIEFRQHQGLQTALFSTQDIYNSVNSGTPSPDAIKKFLTLLSERTGDFPDYLLLIGDYSYEIVHFEQSKNFLPSFFIQTSVAGETVSDFPYSDLNNDSLSDLSVGRIPVSNQNELSIWVNKILEYEKQNNLHLSHFISVSDPSSPIFEQSATNALQSLNKFSHLLKTSLSDGDELIRFHGGDNFKGNSVLIYFGHGSINRWGKQPILTTQQLEITKLPSLPAFIFSFSCLNGYYIHPENRSISETFLFQPNNGTIAFFASTSLTYHENQLKFSNQLISELQLKENVRVGDLITSSMREINSDDPNNRDVIMTFILLGDPATRFPLVNDS